MTRRKSVRNKDRTESNLVHTSEMEIYKESILSALGSVLQLTDRILTGERVVVGVASGVVGVPGYTELTTGNIVINGDMIKSLFDKHHRLEPIVRIFKGTNYHELAHVIFTPRKDSAMAQVLKGEISVGFQQAWNILEDMRIETLYTSLYQPTTGYFRVTAFEWLLRQNLIPVEMIHLWTTGRKYLPRKFREKYANLYARKVGLATAVRATTLAEEYMTMPLWEPAMMPRFRTIISEYALLLSPTAAGNALGCCNGAQILKRCGKDLSDQSASESAVQELVKQIKQEKELADPSKDEESGESDNSSDGTEDDELEKKMQSAQSLEEDALEELVKAESSIQEDVKQTVEAVANRVTGRSPKLPSKMGGASHLVTLEMKRTALHIERSLHEIRNDLESEWLRDFQIGRLNIRRVIARKANLQKTELFDQWYEGREDEATTECVLVVDLSGSMARVMGQLSQSLWTIKYALDRARVRTTVIGFSDASWILYDPEQKLATDKYTRFQHNIGTYPMESVSLADRILGASKCTNKVFIILTDGEWQHQNSLNGIVWRSGTAGLSRSDALISSMRRRGMRTVLVNFRVPNVTLNAFGHNCEIVDEIDNLGDLTGIVDHLVENIMEEAKLR